MSASRFAVVLTHNRPELLRECVAAVAPQTDLTVVVDNASEPPVPDDGWPANVEVRHDPTQPPNLGALWNAVLDDLAGLARASYDVALLCDDAVVPAGWFEAVATPMREYGAAAASAHSYDLAPAPYLLTQLTNGPDRLCPWAMILAGERGLRADTSMAWWYFDTDLDWQARLSGGSLVVPAPVVPNLRLGEYTARPDLAAQAARDGETFRRKWGI